MRRQGVRCSGPVWRPVLAAGFSLVLAGLCYGADEPSPWLRGYARTTSGETIVYHSPYPNSTSALIARASAGRSSIAWETEPVPDRPGESAATFIWMAGLATGKGAHRFGLEVEGIPVLSFRTSPDAARTTWDAMGQNGIALAFRTAMVDSFDELFGYMFLTVPRSMLEPGRPLHLKITGEDAGSPDWVMVFEDRLAASVAAREEQVLVRNEAGPRQLLRVEIRHIAPPAEAEISAETGGVVRMRLAVGYNVLGLPIPAAETERDIALKVAVRGRSVWEDSVHVKPVKPREIWLLPHSHVDIGYSDPQPEVERKQWQNFEEAIRLAARSAENPEGARFKWNVEQLWAVETYLRQADEDKRQAFLNAVRKGWIGLQATLAGELTGLCDPEELFHLTDYARRIARLSGIPVDSAMVSDIPSQSWAIVPALAEAGVKSLSSGPNYSPSLPDGGDRIGWALKTWGDRPFYWLSPSGDRKLLFWMAGRGYSWFHGFHMGNIGRASRWRIFDYVDELDAADYPYSMIQVRYTVGGDNGPPDPELASFVKAWNEEYASPRMVIATTSEMFAAFVERHGRAIPSVKGDFAGYWEDGAASSALETAENRLSAARLRRAESLWALVAPHRFPAARFAEAWRQILLFDEHTWGAADSISNPEGADARTQWAYKRTFATEGARLSRSLLDEARSIHGSPPSRRRTLDVVNTCSWVRTDLVILPDAETGGGTRVTDTKGRPVPAQKLANGDLAFLAADVPALGSRRFFVDKGAPRAAGRALTQGNAVQNGLIRAEVDQVSGAMGRLLWTAGGNIELVNQDFPPGLNGYIYVPGRDPKASLGLTNVSIRPGEPGPLVASVIVEAKAPGARSLRTEVRVIDGLCRLEILNVLDKAAVRDKESVHFAFPLNVPEGTVRLDTGWALIRPRQDEIAGACRDFFGAQKSVDISNGNYGVTWTPVDAPLAEIGAITDETLRPGDGRAWRTEVPPGNVLYSYAMNNYWHTNYRADQEGPVTLRYTIEPHGTFDESAVKRLGLEAVNPLVSLPAGDGTAVPRLPFSVTGPEFVVTCCKPSADGLGWIVRAFNAGGRVARLNVAWTGPGGHGVWMSGLDEGKVRRLEGPLEVPGNGIVTLRLERL